MNNKKVEMISNIVNSPVVQIDGRSYPGVVIQGDSLYSLFRSADRLISSLDIDSDEYDAAEFIRDSLNEYLSIYESELSKKGLSLPYVKPDGEK